MPLILPCGLYMALWRLLFCSLMTSIAINAQQRCLVFVELSVPEFMVLKGTYAQKLDAIFLVSTQTVIFSTVFLLYRIQHPLIFELKLKSFYLVVISQKILH